MTASGGITVRPMEDGDLDAVVGLLAESLGPAPGGVDRRTLFEWKHLGNPFGRSLALVAELEGRIVGLRSFMRWRFVAPDRSQVHAVRAVDTATSAAAQRRGIFSRLTREALAACEAEGVAFVFNTPNARSLPGYLKMGWTQVARWPLRVRVRRPLPLLRAFLGRDLGSGPAVPPPPGSSLAPAAEALERHDVARVVEASERPRGRLFTPRSALFMKWRYAAGPIPYHVLTTGEPVEALAVVRLRRRGPALEAVVPEVLWLPQAAARVPGLLRGIPRAARADHAVVHAGRGWGLPEAVSRAGYRGLARAAMTFTARPVVPPGAGWDPLDPEAWSLTLGDLEVF